MIYLVGTGSWRGLTEVAVLAVIIEVDLLIFDVSGLGGLAPTDLAALGPPALGVTYFFFILGKLKQVYTVFNS